MESGERLRLRERGNGSFGYGTGTIEEALSKQDFDFHAPVRVFFKRVSMIRCEHFPDAVP